jgi:mannitol-1-phosphate 5-dehydrogenase
MKAVIFGAGRIGCGLAGQLLRASGYQVTFITRDSRVVENLNHNRGYNVLLTSAMHSRSEFVDGIKAIQADDNSAALDGLADADLIATAVCSQNLPTVAPLIAQALSRREKPCNVIAFENMPEAGMCLRRLVASHMSRPAEISRYGFSGAVISRIVTHRLGDPAGSDPLTFVGEMVETFVVDRIALRAPLPEIRGMRLVSNYQPSVLHKLYTFSAGHATAAYLGWLKGYHYIHTAIRDQEIRRAVLNAMTEGQRGLVAKFGQEFAGNPEELEEIIARFENAALNDAIARVARDPQRKLSSNERLVGAAKLAEQAGILPEQLALVTAAALCFRNSTHDEHCSACFEQSQAAEVLNQICGLDAAHGFGRVVAKSWAQLAPSTLRGNLLLSLHQRLWARV